MNIYMGLRNGKDVVYSDRVILGRPPQLGQLVSCEGFKEPVHITGIQTTGDVQVLFFDAEAADYSRMSKAGWTTDRSKLR